MISEENLHKLFVCLGFLMDKESLLIGVQSGDSGGISVTGETPQERGFSRRGGSPHAPRKASARNGNQHGLAFTVKKRLYDKVKFKRH